MVFVKRKNGGDKGNYASNEIHKNGGSLNELKSRGVNCQVVSQSVAVAGGAIETIKGFAFWPSSPFPGQPLHGVYSYSWDNRRKKTFRNIE